MSGDSKDLAVREHGDDEPELLNVGSDWRWRPQADGTGIIAALVVILILLLMLVGNHNDDGVDIAPVVVLIVAAVAIIGKIGHQALLRYWGAIKGDQIP